MSLFAGLAKRAITYQDYWGSAQSPPVRGGSEAQALRLAAVYGAVRMLSDGLASLPLRAHRATGTARQRLELPTLVADPTQFGTSYDWLYQVVSSLALRGNAYGLPTARDDLGRVTRVEWLHPDHVALNGQDDVLYGPPQWLVEGRLVPELVHVRNFILPGRILGLSPIQAYRTVTEVGVYAQEFGRDWFRNGSVPSAVLETEETVSDGTARLLKQRFKEAAAEREPVALGVGAKYKPISVPANESQFLETIRATATTIAAIYGVPPEDVGGETGSSLTYNNQEARAARFVTFSLRPYMVRVEAALSRLLPPGIEVRFEGDALIRTDTLSRYQAHSHALHDGWLNRDEVRASEDLPPLPDGEGQTYQPMSGPTPPPREGS